MVVVPGNVDPTVPGNVDPTEPGNPTLVAGVGAGTNLVVVVVVVVCPIHPRSQTLPTGLTNTYKLSPIVNSLKS